MLNCVREYRAARSAGPPPSIRDAPHHHGIDFGTAPVAIQRGPDLPRSAIYGVVRTVAGSTLGFSSDFPSCGLSGGGRRCSFDLRFAMRALPAQQASCRGCTLSAGSGEGGEPPGVDQEVPPDAPPAGAGDLVVEASARHRAVERVREDDSLPPRGTGAELSTRQSAACKSENIPMDLQSTLSANFREMGTNPLPTRIKEKEQYKQCLVDWLRQVQQASWEFHLFTVRNNDRRNAILESIRVKTGWQPDQSWFKSTESGAPPVVKSACLDRLVSKRNPSALYAFESNSDTRRMFKEPNIHCRPISDPDDLPAQSEFTGS